MENIITEDQKAKAIKYAKLYQKNITDSVPEVSIKETTELWKKLNSIEEKSQCGTVKSLDYIANKMTSFANWQIKVANKVRNLTISVKAPCTIKFKK